MFEVDLGGEEGGGGDLVRLPARRQQRQRGGKRGASDAIADGVDGLDAEQVADGVDRVQLPAQNVNRRG
jgi:hypothetical protein